MTISTTISPTLRCHSGPFVKVLAITSLSASLRPMLRFRGDLGRHLHFYAGLRNEQIELINTDKISPPIRSTYGSDSKIPRPR